VRTKINVEYKLEGFSFRDFQNLSYNARKIYEKKYKFKKECADISHKFCTFFEICFKEINRLPIMAPSESFPSENKRAEWEIGYNTNALLDIFLEILDENRLIKPEIKEIEKNIRTIFLEKFENNKFVFKEEILLDYLNTIA
jgi:hypothetical protein